MTSAELRIGNLIKCNPKFSEEISIFVGYDDELTKIKYLSDKNDKYWSLGCHISQLIPIPLTEEWLLKFGFIVKIDMAKLMNNGVSKINLRRFGMLGWHYTYDTIGMMEGIELKHVHQLQNLYFALTGEELTIKD